MLFSRLTNCLCCFPSLNRLDNSEDQIVTGSDSRPLKDSPELRIEANLIVAGMLQDLTQNKSNISSIEKLKKSSEADPRKENSESDLKLYAASIIKSVFKNAQCVKPEENRGNYCSTKFCKIEFVSSDPREMLAYDMRRKSEEIMNLPLLPHVSFVYNDVESIETKKRIDYKNEKPSDFVHSFLKEFQRFEKNQL